MDFLKDYLKSEYEDQICMSWIFYHTPHSKMKEKLPYFPYFKGTRIINFYLQHEWLGLGVDFIKVGRRA
jgi:hypothetical protein